MEEKNEYKAVSIIIATYNVEKYLQRCLDSIYAQDNKKLGIIVIDGGSTDNTIDIIQKNAANLKFWKTEPDEGIYDALNKGINEVNTDWVYFLGADDYLLPDFSLFSTGLSDLQTIYYGNVLYKNRKESGKLSAYRMAKHGIFHQAIIYPKTVFDKYRYNTRYPIAADYDLNMRCYGDSSLSFKYVDCIIACYNDNGLSSYNVDGEFLKSKDKTVYANFGFWVQIRYWFRKMKARISSL